MFNISFFYQFFSFVIFSLKWARESLLKFYQKKIFILRLITKPNKKQKSIAKITFYCLQKKAMNKQTVFKDLLLWIN